MNSQEIRNRVNGLYNTIKQANADLADVRSKCPHESTHTGEYSWAAGHSFPATICNSCDECIEHLRIEVPYSSITVSNIMESVDAKANN